MYSYLLLDPVPLGPASFRRSIVFVNFVNWVVSTSVFATAVSGTGRDLRESWMGSRKGMWGVQGSSLHWGLPERVQMLWGPWRRRGLGSRKESMVEYPFKMR